MCATAEVYCAPVEQTQQESEKEVKTPSAINRMHSTPVKHKRSNRQHAIATLSSAQPGVCWPLVAVPILREDAVSGKLAINVEMQETKEILMNPVTMRVTAYVVPYLAFPRFKRMRDILDKSYYGEAPFEGEAVIPFFVRHAMGTHGSKAVYKALGLHAKSTDLVNTAYLEAYNLIWNHRAKNRSPDIDERDILDATLAPAFWQHGRFDNVVPKFDDAAMDGEVALNVVDSRLPVKGIGKYTSQFKITNANARETGGEAVVYPKAMRVGHTVDVDDNVLFVREDPDNAGFLGVYAEMADNGIKVSLSNIELAKKTVAYAELRKKYTGYDDEYIIDMLMEGLSIPDEDLKRPMLVADRTVRFGQAKRYATDAGNLAESAVSGVAGMSLNIRVPRLPTGGILIVQAECVPVQLFERQRDPLFFTATTDTLPEADRDDLDPQKIYVVKNVDVDTAHSQPNDTFGYAAQNWPWTAFGPRVGGKFYRPTSDTSTDEERQRLWALEVIDPVLSSDFYLVSNVHTKPFLDTESDPFEASVMGGFVLNGLTQFGPQLIEAENNYDKVLEDVDQTRIDPEAE